EAAPEAPQAPAEPVAEAAPAPAPVPEVAASAPASPAPSAPAATSITPPQFGAAYLNNPRPQYPLAARRLRETGVSLLRVVVSAEGRPISLAIEKSSGSPRLDTAALQAVRDWKFVPARAGERAVEGTVLVPIHWKLEN
ncbi:MAG: energy transducer TonB, partial [Moraxellaceae bacterium]